MLLLCWGGWFKAEGTVCLTKPDKFPPRLPLRDEDWSGFCNQNHILFLILPLPAVPHIGLRWTSNHINIILFQYLVVCQLRIWSRQTVGANVYDW